MAVTECAKGHLYNTDQYAACPYCNNIGKRIDFIANEAEAPGQGRNGTGQSGANRTVAPESFRNGTDRSGINKTVAPESFRNGTDRSGINKTVAPESFRNGTGQSGINKTVAPESYRNGREHQGVNKTTAPRAYGDKTERTGANKTVGIFEKIMNIEPVAGWIVCIEGPDKGRDFQIKARNNSIGRSENMDICISGDPTISRENHARLSYDLKNNDFYIIPLEPTNNIYLNNQPVYVPTKLSAYDLLELGESKFLFVPFCNDKFKWNAENR